MNLESVGSLGFTGSAARPVITDAPAQTAPWSSAVGQNSPASEAPRQKPDKEELAQMTKAVNDFVKPLNSALQFNIDDSTGQTVVKVIDTDTKEVIKQIPSEDMLALAKALDQIKGFLVKQKA